MSYTGAFKPLEGKLDIIKENEDAIDDESDFEE